MFESEDDFGGVEPCSLFGEATFFLKMVKQFLLTEKTVRRSEISSLFQALAESACNGLEGASSDTQSTRGRSSQGKRDNRARRKEKRHGRAPMTAEFTEGKERHAPHHSYNP